MSLEHAGAAFRQRSDVPGLGGLLEHAGTGATRLGRTWATASSGVVAQVGVPVPDSSRPGQPSDPSLTASRHPQKRSRAHFEAGTPPGVPDLDPISAGLMMPEAAESYFAAFFSGCDRDVPVFDRRHDTLESVRHRSTLLFSAICSVGCRVLTGAESHESRLLGVHTQRLLNVAIASRSGSGSLEAVQALLVRACYAPERSVLLAVATRMALDIGLPEAYGVLSAQCVTNNDNNSSSIRSRGVASSSTASTSSKPPNGDDDATLMRKTRTWLHLLMMGQILHVDADGAAGFRVRGAAQRCRILLDSPHSTDIDLHLYSQVELNALRTHIHSALSHHIRTHAPPTTGRLPKATGSSDSDADEEILALVSDAQLNLRVWHDDWTRISSVRRPVPKWLAPSLYLHLVRLSIDKFSHAMRLSRSQSGGGPVESAQAHSDGDRPGAPSSGHEGP